MLQGKNLVKQAPLADWGGNELIIRLQAGSIPAGRTENSKLNKMRNLAKKP